MNKNKNKNKINIGFFVRMFIPMVFPPLKEAIKNIENTPARMALELALAEVENAVDLLTDADKENGKQFAKYYSDNWREISEKLLDVVNAIIKDKTPEVAKDVANIYKKISEM